MREDFKIRLLIVVSFILCLSFSGGIQAMSFLQKAERKVKHKHHSTSTSASSRPGRIKRGFTAIHHRISRVLVHITPPFRSYHILHIKPTASHTLFDEGWLFKKDSTLDASAINFADSAWRKLDLPHDWSIEDLNPAPSDNSFGPFSKTSISGSASGNTLGGTAWYRKHFNTGDFGFGRRTVLEFEGVYMNTEVWLNGHLIASHAYGYTPFNVELSDFMNPAGLENVLAVKVRNTGKNSRWYSGSGIYRHVWLHSMPALHLVPNGIQVLTPRIKGSEADIEIRTSVKNKGPRVLSFKMLLSILDSSGHLLKEYEKKLSIESGKENVSTSTFTLDHVDLWSCENPYLYTAIVRIESGHNALDEQKVNFGIRTLSYNAQQGLLLNGTRILLKGGCIHHDNGILGSAAIDRAEERKVELLKFYGFNAVRTSHNPPSNAFLNACDHKGILVIDEAFDMWQKPKNASDYHLYFDRDWKSDLDAMLMRDRNHPSIIMWSIGNEIQERADSSGLQIGKKLVSEVKHLDSTRPVTMAVCSFWDNKKYTWDRTAPTFANLDVAGYNYAWKEYTSDHKKYPRRMIVGTESFPNEAEANWLMVEKNPWIIGDFVWTAIDYLGEAGLAHTYLAGEKPVFSKPFPTYNAWCGDIDLCGFKKPQSYYRDVVWGKSMIEILVHRPVKPGKIEKISSWGWPDELNSWTWEVSEGTPMQVAVYSAYSRVRLKLNGKIIAEKNISDTSNLTAHFLVPYAKGTLEACGIMNGKEINSTLLSTVGKPASIHLIADRTHISGRNDLSYITVEIIDDAGKLIPEASLPLNVQIQGPGELSAFGNSSPDDASSFLQTIHQSFRGRALAIIRPIEGKTGPVTILFSSPGLKESKISIESK